MKTFLVLALVGLAGWFATWGPEIEAVTPAVTPAVAEAPAVPVPVPVSAVTATAVPELVPATESVAVEEKPGAWMFGGTRSALDHPPVETKARHEGGRTKVFVGKPGAARHGSGTITGR